MRVRLAVACAWRGGVRLLARVEGQRAGGVETDVAGDGQASSNRHATWNRQPEVAGKIGMAHMPISTELM